MVWLPDLLHSAAQEVLPFAKAFLPLSPVELGFYSAQAHMKKERLPESAVREKLLFLFGKL